MQSLEAFLSLLFFVSILFSVIPAIEQKPVDDSIYLLQLAEDSWRVLYLRGNFQDLSGFSRVAVESDMAKIGDLTGLCFFIDGIQFTNCRSGEPHQILISIPKTVIFEKSAKTCTFSVAN